MDIAQHYKTKLPGVGTSIFTVMSKMAVEYNAINLSQGFPDFKVSEELIQLVTRYMQMGMNQYSPMAGEPVLREAIANKANRLYNTNINADTEVTITAGATEALFATIAALIETGDEVIIMEPAYDSYVPAIELFGGIVKRVELCMPDYSIDWDRVRDLISPRTRMIIVNTPHNPTGAVLYQKDLETLNELVRNTDITVLSDEVYEHIIFDNLQHESVLAYPELRERSAAVYSFGKTFHATGWKVGYVVAPPHITQEVRKVHQYLTFSVHAPTQFALADYLLDECNYDELPEYYQQKRDLFLDLIKGSAFEPVPCRGTYFQLLSYRNLWDKPDTEVAEMLTKEYGLASVPISVFYESGRDERILRFCFAKNDLTLEKAASILCQISS